MLSIHRKNISVLVVLLVWNTLVAWGQTVISGIVCEASSKKALPEVICMITDASGKVMLDYGFSDKEGKYSLRTTHEGDSIVLTCRMMSFRTVVLRLPNHSQTKDVMLLDDDFRLKEVVVKAPPVIQHGDTISYNVSALKSAGDIAIVDVIKKLPGVDVSENGKISYQGKAINKFYIEGMDLLGGKYSLATTSVPVDAVASVQVLENHQPIKTLEETSFSEYAAMNLKLKEGKKLHPVGQATLGGGISDGRFKYSGILYGLMLSEKGQGMLSLKTNNSGTPLANELVEHTYEAGSVFNALSYNPVALVAPSENNLSAMPAQYGVFNESYLGSYNHLFKLSKDWEVKVNGSYVDEQLENRQEETVVYDVLGENPLTIVNNQLANNHHRQGNLSFHATKNGEKQYVNNQFRLSGDWSESMARQEGTNPSLQNFEQPFFLMENKLNFIAKRKSGHYAIRSFLRFQNQPQEVRFNNGDSLVQVQERDKKLFYTVNDIQMSYSFKNSEVSLNAGFKIETNRIRSMMDGVPEYLDDYTTASLWNYLQAGVFVTPTYRYNGKGYYLTLGVPLVWQKTDAERKGSDEQSFNHFMAIPTARFYWKLNRFWELMASGSYRRSPTSYENLNDTYYYKNRNLLQRGIDELGTDEDIQSSLNLYYRNAIQAFWGRLNFAYTQSESNLISGYDFVETQPIHTWQQGERSYKLFSARGNVGKILDAIHTNLELNVGYSHSLYSIYQQKDIRDVRSNQGYVMFSSNTRLATWWDWELQWNSSFVHNKGYEIIWNHSMGSSMTFSFGKCSFIPKLNYVCNQLETGRFKSSVIVDATLRYKQQRWSFDILCANLLDTREYSLSLYDGINQYNQLWLLRSRQIMAKVRLMF